jgi:hypothetical protein
VKTTILTFSDSNMVGFSWSWNFNLEDQKKGAYGLSCEQVTTDDDEAIMIEPVSGLRSGADVYSALESMLSEAGYSLAEDELSSIGAKIAKLDRRLAEQFERGHEPTYTWEEEQDFYRRMGGGPKVVLHAPAAKKPAKPKRSKPVPPIK